MSRFVAFLRAINIGHGRTINMKSLRKAFEALGFSEVATFFTSGNVVFETRARNARMLEKKIEKKLREALGFKVAIFLRTDADVTKLGNHQPFRQSKVHKAAEVNIIFLADVLDEKTKQKVRGLKTDTDQFRVRGREIYWLRRQKKNGATFASVPLEKTIGEPFTIRGFKTVKKIAAKLGANKYRSS
jgi:uncharacterized protein (DUF1697 family)